MLYYRMSREDDCAGSVSRNRCDSAHAQDRAGAPDVSSHAQNRAGAPDVAVRMRRTGLAHRMWQCACAGQSWRTGCGSVHAQDRAGAPDVSVRIVRNPTTKPPRGLG